METIENIKSNHLHLGKKIERVRRLRGMTQTVLYNTNNFYENCGVKNAIGNNQTFNNFPIEQTIELFEKLLEKQKEQFESLKKEK